MASDTPAGEALLDGRQPFERFPTLANHIARLSLSDGHSTLVQWNDFLRELNAALRRPAPAEAERLAGWRLAPEEPTTEILDAFWRQAGESEEMRLRVHERAKHYWKAMLSALPAAPREDTP